MLLSQLKIIIFWNCVTIVFLSCKIHQKISDTNDSVHKNDSLEMWYFSGFLKNEKNSEQYFLSNLIFHKAQNSQNSGQFSFHTALTNMDSGNYFFRIYNPENTEGKISDDAGNLDIHFKNDSRDLQLKKEKRNYLLKAISEKEGDFNFTIFCGNDKMDTVNVFCPNPAVGSMIHSLSVFKKTKGTLDFKEEEVKMGGKFFYNRFRNATSLMNSSKQNYLLNVQLDNTGEFYTFIFTNEKSNSELPEILSVCSTKKKINKTDIQIKPVAFWESPKFKKTYPVKWEIKIPSENIEMNLTATVENQEIFWMKNSYWMGSYWVTLPTDSTKKIGKATAIIF